MHSNRRRTPFPIVIGLIVAFAAGTARAAAVCEAPAELPQDIEAVLGFVRPSACAVPGAAGSGSSRAALKGWEIELAGVGPGVHTPPPLIAGKSRKQ